jgi:hypothetical protein
MSSPDNETQVGLSLANTANVQGTSTAEATLDTLTSPRYS